jgi:hypothetical protein
MAFWYLKICIYIKVLSDSICFFGNHLSFHYTIQEASKVVILEPCYSRRRYHRSQGSICSRKGQTDEVQERAISVFTNENSWYCMSL